LFADAGEPDMRAIMAAANHHGLEISLDDGSGE
jgi:hypothetical protein